MMNFGDLKKYLRDGKRREDMIGVPRSRLAKEGDVKVGFVTFKEDEKTGKKEIVGVEEAEKVEVKGGEGGKVEVAGIGGGEKGTGNGEQGTEDEGTSEGVRKSWRTRKGMSWSQTNSNHGYFGRHSFKKDNEFIGKDKVNDPRFRKAIRLEASEAIERGLRASESFEKKYGIAPYDLIDAQDKMPVSLAEHDARFHPAGFKEGDSCNVREVMGRGDSADRIEAAEGREAVEKECGESDVAAYEVLAMPVHAGRWNDGRSVDENDLPRVRAMLDKFMLKHPEIAAVNEDAYFDLENAVGRTPGWHLNDAKADTAEVWCDDDVDLVVEELLDTPDGRMRDLFDCFYPESHFDDEEAECGRDEAYQQAVRLAVNWAFHDNPLVWANADAAALNWAYTAKNGHVVNIGAMADAVQRLIGAAAEQVARRNDPVERYLAVAM